MGKNLQTAKKMGKQKKDDIGRSLDMESQVVASDQIDFDKERDALREELRLVELEMKSNPYNRSLYTKKREILLRAGRLAVSDERW